jgi:site-specific DNA recombinase
MEEGVQILELARNAQKLFERQEPRQKRRLLNFLPSNCSWEDGEVRATFRQSLDFLAQITVAAASANAQGGANFAKSEIWLGDLDSNQD